MPAAIQVVCATDHLLVVQHRELWQDTVRKGVHPPTYLDNLGKDLDGYLVTPAGKRKAARMLEERAAEVRSWQEWVDRLGSEHDRREPQGAPPARLRPPDADVSHITRKWLDIPYAQHSPRRSDWTSICRQTGAGPFPVLLNIHGGAFAHGDKRDIPLLPLLRGLSRGYAVVSVNYRLSGEAIFPAGLQDVKAAIRWFGPAAASTCSTRTGSSPGELVGRQFRRDGGHHRERELFDDPALGNAGHPCHVRCAGGLVRADRLLHHGRATRRERLGPLPTTPRRNLRNPVYLGAQIA